MFKTPPSHRDRLPEGSPIRARPTSLPDRLVDELERRLRGIALAVSTSLAAKADAAQLRLVDAHVLLALSEPDRATDAIELSVGSGVPLDVVYPALDRLMGYGYVYEERLLQRLTDAGQVLVAALDRARRDGIRSYVAQLNPDELLRLESVLSPR